MERVLKPEFESFVDVRSLVQRPQAILRQDG